MAYTYSLADAGDDTGRYYSARRYDDENINKNTRRLDHHLQDNKDRDTSKRRQARWRSSGVGVTSTLSGTICPLHGDHHHPDPPPEDPPTPSELLPASSTGRHRRSRNACTPERDTGWRDPPRSSRDTYYSYGDDQEGEGISLSLGFGWGEPGSGSRTRCPTHRQHQCPPAAAPTRLSPWYEGCRQQDTRGSAGNMRQVQVQVQVQVPPHVSTAHQQRSATEETTEQNNTGVSQSRFRGLGTSAPPVNSGAPQGRFRDLGTSAPPVVGSYVSRDTVCEPFARDKSWAVSYQPTEEEAAPPPPPLQRGRGAGRGATVLDRRGGNPEPEATSAPAVAAAAAVSKSSVRSLQWKAHLVETRIMKHVSDVAY